MPPRSSFRLRSRSTAGLDREPATRCVKKSKDGQFYFNLHAGNNEIILTSEMYRSKSGCKNGIASVKKNSTEAGRYDRRVNKDGEDYFVLKAGNHQIIGVSEAYNSKTGMDNGIASVTRNARLARIDDLAV